jgi:hypothetical protein
MEKKRRWFRVSTAAFMAILLIPFLPANVQVVTRASGSWPTPLPWIVYVMVFVLLTSQVAFAYFVALMCDWILDAGGTRHWIQFRLSTCLILMVIMSLLVGANLNLNMYEQGHSSLSRTLFNAFANTSVYVFFVFGVMMLMALSPAINRNVSSPSGAIPVEDAEHTRNPAVSRRIQIIGALPLGLLVLLVFAAGLSEEEIKPIFRASRVELPPPSILLLQSGRLIYKYPEVVIFFSVGALWAYDKWISHDRRRIFWFNVIVVGIVLFGLVMLAMAVIAPFFFEYNSCIIKGTPISTRTGHKPIEDLNIGDEVLSRTKSGEIAIGTVTDVRSALVIDHLNVRLEGGVELSCTGEHPIAVGNQWIRAKLLRPGDEVPCIDQTRRVIEIKTVSQQTTVVDITVEPHHNFFADSVLVHNKLRKK